MDGREKRGEEGKSPHTPAGKNQRIFSQRTRRGAFRQNRQVGGSQTGREGEKRENREHCLDYKFWVQAVGCTLGWLSAITWSPSLVFASSFCEASQAGSTPTPPSERQGTHVSISCCMGWKRKPCPSHLFTACQTPENAKRHLSSSSTGSSWFLTLIFDKLPL